MDDLDVYERASCLGLVEVISIYYVLPLSVAQKLNTARFPKTEVQIRGILINVLQLWHHTRLPIRA